MILTALCSVLCPQILHILSVPEDIYDNAYSYLLIIFLGIPFTILYNYLSSILRSVGDSRTPFIFLALSERTYLCECGNRMDRDVNAAVNILEEGKRIYKKCA